MPAPAPRSRNLLLWALTQLSLFAQLLGIIVVGGIIRAVARRTFSWPGFVSAASTIFVGLSVTYIYVFTRPGPLQGGPELVLWLGTFATFGAAGFASGLVGRRVGVFESQLAFYLTAAVLGVHLFRGWHVIFELGAAQPEAYLEYVATTAPGERLLGAMWDRVAGLAALGSFLMTVFGGSFAFLFFGEDRRFDAGFGFEWSVARKHLGGRSALVSVTALVAVLGVALGVGALVTVTAVMSGYQQDVQDKILSTNAHLVVQKYGLDFYKYDEVATQGLEVPEVLAATPFSFNEAMLSDGDLGLGVLIKGIVPETAGAVTSINENICRVAAVDQCERLGDEGTAEVLSKMLRPNQGRPSVVIGSELFDRLGMPLGGTISLTTPHGVAGARGAAPRRMQFSIGGTFRSGMHEFDTRLIYMHLTAAQELMGLGSAVNGVEFRVVDPEQVELVAKDVLSAVGRYPYHTLDWRELNLGIFTALKLQKIVMFLVLCSIIIVGAFNIASTLFMAVVEKSREIGVLKSIGARNGSIMKVFVLEGWLVGATGTLLGLVLGLLVCGLLARLDIGIAADVYMVNSLQVRLNPLEVAGTVIAALAISHLATIYPALKAARQAPVDAMRYE